MKLRNLLLITLFSIFTISAFSQRETDPVRQLRDIGANTLIVGTGTGDNILSAMSTINLSNFNNDLPAGSDNQDLTLTVNTLALTNDATTVDLSGYLDNTDAQAISLATNTLSISGNAGTVDLSGYLDNTDAQTADVFARDATNLNDLDLSLSNDGAGDNTITVADIITSGAVIPAAAASTFTIPAAPKTGNYLTIIYMNGVKQKVTDHYTIAATTVTLVGFTADGIDEFEWEYVAN